MGICTSTPPRFRCWCCRISYVAGTLGVPPLYQQQPKQVSITWRFWQVTSSTMHTIILIITMIIIKQFLIHTHKKNLFLLPTLKEVVLHATFLYPTLQAIYPIHKATKPKNVLELKEGLQGIFPPLMLKILDSPCLLFFLIHTNHKYNKIISWTDRTSLFPWRGTRPLGG